MAVKIKIDSRKCKGCELCMWVCKRDVIKMSQKMNAMSYRFAEPINKENCTGCANCAIICPDVCIKIEEYD